MSWVAVERAIRVARQRGLPADIVRWSAVRDRIYTQIMERGWHEGRRAFVQHTTPTDLVSDSLVYRYDVDASPDGVSGGEATFSLCSFWWVEALARAGRLDEARLTFEKMLTYANHVGLYSEEIGPTGEQLGNFPQAFHAPGADQRGLQPRPAARVSSGAPPPPRARAPSARRARCRRSRASGCRS
jgi:GH15 family glucan-1,4-alpha-glucosidase